MSRSERWLTALITLLGIPVHLVGILSPAIYRDPPVLIPQNRATDVVTTSSTADPGSLTPEP